MALVSSGRLMRSQQAKGWPAGVLHCLHRLVQRLPKVVGGLCVFCEGSCDALAAQYDVIVKIGSFGKRHKTKLLTAKTNAGWAVYN